MATPNADRLHGIESWDTSAIQHANSSLEDVRIALDEIAGINERVAGDLGLEGTTADRVSAKLDSLAKDLKSHAGGIGQLIKVRQEAMQGGIDAKNESADIQAKLGKANKDLDVVQGFGNATSPVGGAGVAANIEEQRKQVHAEFDRRAVEALHTLRAKTDAAIAGLPFQPKVREALRKGAPATFERIDKHFDSNGVRKKFVEGDSSGSSRSVDTIQPVGPRRSATQWYTPGGDAGSAGGHSAGVPGGGGASLQSSHYTPGSQGTFVPSGGSRASVLDSPSVHNPLAMAASVGGGVVAGYKAYQAVRAGRAALAAGRGVSGAGSMRSGAAVRTPVSSSSGIVRGATTAVRATTSSSSASGRGVPARGGASGVARPVSASPARGSSIVRGATTAVRATASSSASSRGSGLVRGATTAVRATTSESAGGRGMGAGGRGAASAARSAGSPTTRGTEASGRGSGVSGRAGAGTTSARGGAGSSVRGGSSASGRARAETAGRSGVGRGAFSARPAGGSSVSRSGSSVQGHSAASSSRGAISGLTGRGRRKKDDEERRDEYPPIERTHVSLYETDRTVTFLEAGHPEEGVQDRQDERPKGHDHVNTRGHAN